MATRREFPEKEAGDTLGHEHINDLSDVARSVSDQRQSPYSHGIDVHNIGLEPFHQRVVIVVGQVCKTTDDIYTVRYRYYEPDEGVWKTDNDSGPFCLDASSVEGGLNIDDKLGAFWDPQRSMFIPVEADPPSQSTTTTPNPSTRNCQGDCRWIWNDDDGLWEIDQDRCGTASTTTSTTTTGSVTTTTTTTTEQPCDCPSSTITATTTTGEPCQCAPPPFCGGTDGECYYSTCTNNNAEHPDCDSGTTTTTTTGTTTTTTCPPVPPPTTTTDSNGNSGGCTSCRYTNLPGVGTLIDQDGCADANCECPPAPDISECESKTLRCIASPPPPPPPSPSCSGTCNYVCNGSNWILADSSCSATGGISCFCESPSQTCNICSDSLQTSCVTPTTTTAGTTTTTSTPDPCNTTTTTTNTTSTTTTTTTACHFCKYNWDGAAWILEDDQCDPCECLTPNAQGTDSSCEVRFTGCATTTTEVSSESSSISSASSSSQSSISSSISGSSQSSASSSSVSSDLSSSSFSSVSSSSSSGTTTTTTTTTTANCLADCELFTCSGTALDQCGILDCADSQCTWLCEVDSGVANDCDNCLYSWRKCRDCGTCGSGGDCIEPNTTCDSSNQGLRACTDCTTTTEISSASSASSLSSQSSQSSASSESACTGDCTWTWDVGTQAWFLQSFNCSECDGSGTQGCCCQRPSSDGTSDGEQQVTECRPD